MDTIKLPFFGKVKIDKNIVEQDFQTYEIFNDTLVEINLIYETENLNLTDLSIVKIFLSDIEKYISNAKEAILLNYQTNEFIKNYIDFHIEALTPLAKEVLKEIIPKNVKIEEYFLDDLELARIYIFADDENEFIKFIYNISEEITDENLFVRYGKDMLLKEIATEY